MRYHLESTKGRVTGSLWLLPTGQIVRHTHNGDGWEVLAAVPPGTTVGHVRAALRGIELPACVPGAGEARRRAVKERLKAAGF